MLYIKRFFLLKTARLGFTSLLEKFTHSQTPWLSTRGDLSADTVSNQVIAKELIGAYFTAVKEKYNMKFGMRYGIKVLMRFSYLLYSLQKNTAAQCPLSQFAFSHRGKSSIIAFAF